MNEPIEHICDDDDVINVIIDDVYDASKNIPHDSEHKKDSPNFFFTVKQLGYIIENKLFYPIQHFVRICICECAGFARKYSNNKD